MAGRYLFEPKSISINQTLVETRYCDAQRSTKWTEDAVTKILPARGQRVKNNATLILYTILFVSKMSSTGHAEPPVETRTVDLLVVGGTESGCAAAVQAARQGVTRIVLVNDIQWLGGQFSAEGLGAIDENRGEGYDGTVPIPRSGIFSEVIRTIERRNAELYGGVERPGNTRVITTSRPIESERAFRELLRPYEESGTIERFSNYQLKSVGCDGMRIQGAEFESSTDDSKLIVKAKMTIDASDWGDVIQMAGVGWEAGVDPQNKYQEPSAPSEVPLVNDMNPITWCMILEQTAKPHRIPMPHGYDPAYFNGQWGWINEEFAYSSRRLIDGNGNPAIDHADVILVNSPPIDYPVDRYPASVTEALEANQTGASRKSLVAMTPAQREIVFRDAKQHSLKYLFHLQERFPSFRTMVLSDEFGTEDRLPPKPYLRESLRMKAQYMLREQDVISFGKRSNYASRMFPDAVFSWQFELDFHPTHRNWTTDKESQGAWEASFVGNRRFGRGGTGRSVFPIRSLIPRQHLGLLAAQKNLGYSSIVSSSCRLHDQSIHVGQASGAVAAISLKYSENPSTFFLRPERMSEIWFALLDDQQGTPLVIWPFADVAPYQRGFQAIQHLALRRLLPLTQSATSFHPEELATDAWINQIVTRLNEVGYKSPANLHAQGRSRAEIAETIWRQILDQPIPKPTRLTPNDADGDGIEDLEDPLPFNRESLSWVRDPSRDGLPDQRTFALGAKRINFRHRGANDPEKFLPDIGEQYCAARGYGWISDMTENTRHRQSDSELLRSGFVFTRSEDVWQCKVDNGKWIVTACLGDSSHPQPGQHLAIEGTKASNETIDTDSGDFFEITQTVLVMDGYLTITVGDQGGGTNTCLNWVIIEPGDITN